MKAWRIEAAHEPFRLVEVEKPTPKEGQVLIKVRAAGLCHTDYGVQEGSITPPGGLPMILGHEASGVIAELGEGVTGFEIGDAVAVTGGLSDTPGGTHDGAYAEYFIATAERVVKLPPNTDWGQAAAATDAGLAAYSGVIVRGQVKKGDRVCIIGLGGLGLVGARIAVVAGAEVYGVEPKEGPWELAREQGATKVVKDISEYKGMDFDVIIDFAGFGSTINGALSAVKYGGRIVLVGMGQTEFPIRTFDFITRNITICGAASQGNPADLKAVIDMINSGELTIKAEKLSFDEIPEGLARLGRGEVTGRLYAELPE